MNGLDRIKNSQPDHLVSTARTNSAALQHAVSPNSQLARWRSSGNQEAQRFAQSCPLSLPSPGVCPFGGVCHTCPVQVQAELKIGQPGDEYEQEADRVAEQIMRMPESSTQNQTQVPERARGNPTQRACTQCDKGSDREPLEEEEGILQTKEVPGHTLQVTPDLVGQINDLQGRGQPLPESTRALLERCFGYDLSQVRVHSNGQAAETAQALNARAFTIGRNIAFATGEYRPYTVQGKRLLAHELTHYVQNEDMGNSDVIRRTTTLYYVADGFNYSSAGQERQAHTTGTWQPSSADFVNTINAGLSSAGPNPALVHTGDITNFLYDIEQQPAGSIAGLLAVGHGRSGELCFSGSRRPNNTAFELDSSTAISSSNLDGSHYANRQLEPHFSPAAVITLSACRCGANAAFIQRVADFFGRSVRGFSRDIVYCTQQQSPTGETRYGGPCQPGYAHLTPDVTRGPQ